MGIRTAIRRKNQTRRKGKDWISRVAKLIQIKYSRKTGKVFA